jgi:hypothetical protein
VIGYPKHSPQQKSGFVGFEEKFFCSWNENNPKKRAGAMGYYPTEGHCELNPGAAATHLRRELLSDAPIHPFLASQLTLPN